MAGDPTDVSGSTAENMYESVDEVNERTSQALAHQTEGRHQEAMGNSQRSEHPLHKVGEEQVRLRRSKLKSRRVLELG